MTLPLPTQVDDPLTQQCLDRIAQQFPIRQSNLATSSQFVSTLAAKAARGAQVFYEAAKTSGQGWNLIYTGEGEFPWMYAGGSPLFSEVPTAESTSKTEFVNLATEGPKLTLPFKGEYEIEIGARLFGGTQCIMSYAIGAAAAAEEDSCQGGSPGGSNVQIPGSRPRTKKIASAGTAIVAKYKSFSGIEAGFADRWMRIQPVRVG